MESALRAALITWLRDDPALAGINAIDEESPLWGFTNPRSGLELGITSINAVVQGHEEVYGHVISTRHIFLPNFILFNHR